MRGFRALAFSFLLIFSAAAVWAGGPGVEGGQGGGPGREALPSAADILPPGLALPPDGYFLVKDTGTGGTPTLAPGPGTQTVPADSRTLRIEFLALFPANQAGTAPPAGQTLSALALAAVSVGSLKGLEYWSASRQKMRTLYEEAYRVVSSADRRAVPDPGELAALGPGPVWRFTAYLRDLTFGGYLYSYVLRIEKDRLLMESENLETLRYAFLPLAVPGGVRNSIMVIPCAEGLLVHSVTTVTGPGIAARRIFESAGNKNLALLRWFSDMASRRGLSAPMDIPVDVAEIRSAR